MKRLFLLAIVALTSISSLMAAVEIKDNIPAELEAVIVSSIEENTRGRNDYDYVVSDFKYDSESYPGKIRVAFRLSFLDNSLDLVVLSNGDKNLSSDISKEIERALYYNKAFEASSDEKLDYIYSSSFSFSSQEKYKRGSTFALLDSNGKKRGMFEVKDRYDDVYLLQPVYLSEARPGMQLEKSSNLRYAISGITNFKKGAFSISAELGYTSLIYPFIPVVAVEYTQSRGKSSIFAGIGLESYVDLNDVFPASFTLLEEGRIGASAIMLLGSSSGSFKISGRYGVFYEHRFAPKLLWRLGYSWSPELGHGFSVSFGGAF